MSQNKDFIHKLAEQYGYLPYMIERYIEFLGIDGTQNLLEVNESPLNPTIRVNTLKIDATNLKKRLEQKNFKFKTNQWIPYGFEVIKEPFNLGSTHEFLQGYYYLQNIASMLSSIILNPYQTDTVVDMCAAPGSKATHLAQLMQNKSTLILVEKNRNRIPALEVNLRRMGITNSIVINTDAINLPKINIKADKILLDAPCTGEGLIRQDPERKKSRTREDIEKMASIQEKLLKAGLKALKSGGLLLYCTCSIAPEENELVVDNILNQLKGYNIVKISKDYGVNGLTEIYGQNLNDSLKFSQRLYPHLHNTIGFFYCLIQKDK
ncbi:MAG: RsmB/NOP family class I SAM-dependent RNA methyltransferase [Candidatus Thorarchaeota archaeon]